MSIIKIEPLLGSWISEPKANELERMQIDFTSDGLLTYTIIFPDKEQKIFLTYRTENNVLFTDQPSSPKEEQTSFIISHDGKTLTLVYDDQPMIFLKIPDSSAHL